MSEPTTYALPDEPEGPVWDRNGGRWDISPVHEMWCGPDGLRLIWADVLRNHGPLTSAPPWKPVVGGTVETEDQYKSMPGGSVVGADGANTVYYKQTDGLWCATGHADRFTSLKMVGTPRTTLRVGWSL